MTYLVTIEPIGEQIEVEEGQTLLDAALRSGVWLPFACGHGNCATCKIQVVEGEVDQGAASPFALMDMERDEGLILACCASPLSDLVVEADLDEEVDAERHPVEDRRGQVTKIWDLSPTVKGIILKLERPMAFQSGQYINLKVPGVEGTRAFSIANPPQRDQEVELHVRLVEGGTATTWLHKELSEGMELEFTGPLGNFFVRRSNQMPLIFVAGGSGLSSPLCMIEDLLSSGWELPITLVHGVRNPDEAYYKDRLEALADENSNFTYLPVIDQPAEGWQGPVGFAHEALSELFGGNFEGAQAYLCGPPPMIDATITALMRGRLFERDIFMENFFHQGSETQKKGSPLFRKI